MTRSFLLAVLAVALVSTCAGAAGINLSWDDCGAHGVKEKNSPCTSEVGVNTLIGSVVPPAGLSRFVGFEALIDVQVQAPSLPDWWKMGTGCRSTALSSSFEFSSGPYNCRDFWQGHAMGGVIMYESDPGNGRSYMRVVAAVAEAGMLAAGSEFYMFKLNITNRGTANCPGCKIPACIQLTNILLVQPAGVGDHLIEDYAHSNVVNWQGGLATPDSELSNCRADAIQNRSWGQVKSLYR